MIYFWIYLAFISLLAVILALHDKSAAKRHTWRVRERTLLLVSALGGSAAMLLTLRLVRHKTKRARFMVGIPLILILQLAIAGLLIWWKAKPGG